MKSKIQEYIERWENRCYPEGIPDEVPNEIKDLAPSYKKIAVAILNNDITLKSLGFTAKKSEYYNIYKKIELEKRKIKQNESSKI